MDPAADEAAAAVDVDDMGDEVAVDLHGVDAESLQVAQRGLAGAEIVDGNLDAAVAAALKLFLADCQVVVPTADTRVSTKKAAP